MVARGRLELDILVATASTTLRPIKTVTIVAALVVAAAGAGTVDAQQASREYEIKAAVLVNFVRLTQWPEGDTKSHRTICVLGENPFGNALQALDGKSAGGGTIETRADVKISEAGGCNVLFISSSKARELPSVLESLEGSSVLTVAETQGFAEAGGMVGMRIDRNKISLELNVAAVQHAGLYVSSQLLQLAKVVH